MLKCFINRLFGSLVLLALPSVIPLHWAKNSTWTYHLCPVKVSWRGFFSWVVLLKELFGGLIFWGLRILHGREGREELLLLGRLVFGSFVHHRRLVWGSMVIHTGHIQDFSLFEVVFDVFKILILELLDVELEVIVFILKVDHFSFCTMGFYFCSFQTSLKPEDFSELSFVFLFQGFFLNLQRFPFSIKLL